MLRKSVAFLFCTLVFGNSCREKMAQNTAENADENATSAPYGAHFDLLPASKTGIDFFQKVAEDFEYNFVTDPYLYNGGGVAILDIDNDGLQDIYFTARQGSCKLYRNKGGFVFEDITASAGVAVPGGLKTGVSVVDVNADGYADLYLCRTGLTPTDQRRNVLFINNKNNTFSDQAKQYGLDDMGASNHANFFDFDRDGDLDLYVMNHPVDFRTMNNPDFAPTPTMTLARQQGPRDGFESDRLYRNEGNGKFVDISKKAGIENRAWGLSTVIVDVNRDGWPDIYVGNDFVMPDFLYINNKNGTFTDQANAYFKHFSNHTMGADWADLDNDGLLDLVSLDMLATDRARRRKLMTTMIQERYRVLMNQGYESQMMRNTLQHNNGDGTFSEIGCLAGVFATDWSWAPLVADFDNDGWKDLFLTNGIRRDLNDMDFFFFTADSINRSGGINQQRFKTFEAFSGLMPGVKLPNFLFAPSGDFTYKNAGENAGLSTPSFSNGAAYCDLDNDGDLDLVVNNVEDQAFVYSNNAAQLAQNQWIQIKCKGPASNSNGYGAKVRVRYGSQVFYQEITANRGYYSSVEPILQVGLGKNAGPVTVEIEWPGGNYQLLENVAVNKRLVLDFAAAKPGKMPEWKAGEPPVFSPQPATVLPFTHKENAFDDFDRERLMTHRYSTLGPCLCKADVNADGMEDLFVGGAMGQAGTLWLQQANGSFTLLPQSAFDTDKAFEDTGAVFFDADKDGDADLYLSSGGNERNPADGVYQDRLYLNDGKGQFTRAANALPRESISAVAITPFDYDGDGDLDLFIGGRTSPNKYPMAPESAVLNNEKGVFTPVTDAVAPDFKKAGMVTDIAFADVSGDGKPDMICAGEWMPISVWEWTGKNFENKTQKYGLQTARGWWNCLAISDLDGDGDMDIAAGNMGLNTRFTASVEKPMRLYAGDFDGNGSVDPILAYQNKGQYYPYQLLDFIMRQVPSIRKRYLKNGPFVKATVEEIFTKKEIDKGVILEAETLESGWFEQNGGKFIFHAFPAMAQFSVIQKIIPGDFNKDGAVDLVLLGNSSAYDVETGPLDASNGLLLEGNGKGAFTAAAHSGLKANLDVRGAVLLGGTHPKVVVANNNAAVQVFTVNK